MKDFLLVLLVGAMVLSSATPVMARHVPAPADPGNVSKMSKAKAEEPVLRIGLAEKQASLILTPLAGKVTCRTETSKALVLPAGQAVTISRQGNAFLVAGKKLAGTTLTLTPANAGTGASFRYGSRSYAGAMQVLARAGGMTLVNPVGIETYLKSVVPEEMPTDWPQEALKAQSVAARSFALHNRGRHGSAGYDLCTTTHCQVYTGTGAERSSANAALRATRGEVLLYHGQPVDALFHTDSGGMTENSEDVWGGYVPYLRAARDPQQKTMPWTKSIPLNTLSAKLAAKGKKVGTIRKVTLSPVQFGKETSDRTVSGRVKTMTVIGTQGTARISGNDMRSMFGLKSTLFAAKIQKDALLLEGYGYGHGLGISQWGAKRLAESGKPYADILHHYYTGVELTKQY